MYKQIEHLLDISDQKYVILNGLQGAGKSTLVEEFEKAGYIIVCPDQIRVDLALKKEENKGKYESEIENLYSNEMLVWKIAEQKVKKKLGENKQ